MTLLSSVSKQYKLREYRYIQPNYKIINNYSLYTKHKNKAINSFDITNVRMGYPKTHQVISGKYLGLRSEILGIKNIFGSLSEFQNNSPNNENLLDQYTVGFGDNTRLRLKSILVENYFEKHIEIMLNSFLNNQNVFNFTELNTQMSTMLRNDLSFKSAILESLKLISSNINKTTEALITNSIDFGDFKVFSKKNFIKILKTELTKYLKLKLFSIIDIDNVDSRLDTLETNEFTNVVNTFVNSVDITQLQEITNSLIIKGFDNNDVIYTKSYICNHFLEIRQDIYNLKYLTKPVIKKENDLIFGDININYDEKISDVIPILDFNNIIKKSINIILLDYFQSSYYENYISEILGKLSNSYYLSNIKFKENETKIILEETIQRYVMSSQWDTSYILSINETLDYNNYHLKYVFNNNIFSDLEYDKFVDSFVESCLILYFYLSLYIYKV